MQVSSGSNFAYKKADGNKLDQRQRKEEEKDKVNWLKESKFKYMQNCPLRVKGWPVYDSKQYNVWQ